LSKPRTPVARLVARRGPCDRRHAPPGYTVSLRNTAVDRGWVATFHGDPLTSAAGFAAGETAWIAVQRAAWAVVRRSARPESARSPGNAEPGRAEVSPRRGMRENLTPQAPGRLPVARRQNRSPEGVPRPTRTSNSRPRGSLQQWPGPHWGPPERSGTATPRQPIPGSGYCTCPGRPACLVNSRSHARQCASACTRCIYLWALAPFAARATPWRDNDRPGGHWPGPPR
jgi:hypothetical protein